MIIDGTDARRSFANERDRICGQLVELGVRWSVAVGATPNPAFRRVDVSVAEAAVPDYALARLTGYVAGTR